MVVGVASCQINFAVDQGHSTVLVDTLGLRLRGRGFVFSRGQGKTEREEGDDGDDESYELHFDG